MPLSRYDYEEVESDKAANVMDQVRAYMCGTPESRNPLLSSHHTLSLSPRQVRKVIAASPKGTKLGPFTVETADDFEYKDPIDGSIASKQGLRFVFSGEFHHQPLPHAPPSFRLRCCYIVLTNSNQI